LAQVLTSSGHGGNGRFSFGLTGREQAAQNEYFIDLAMDEAFQVKARKTLVVNCLPMGVFFSSQCMTVANTSVREDMSVEQAIRHAIPPAVQPENVVLWPHERFPFGMGLDYERKFTYYVP